MQKKPLALLEKIFYYFLVLNPLLDIASGIQLYLLNGGAGSMLSSLDLVNQPSVSPSFGVRMIILLCLALYVLLKKDWKTVALMASIGVVFAATVGYEILRGADFSLWQDILYIVRFCYNLLILIVYREVLIGLGLDTESLRRKMDAVVAWTLAVVFAAIVIPYLLGMGFYTYADPLGYRGCRGFFYSGNDVTATLMLMLPMAFDGLLRRRESIKTRSGITLLLAPGFALLSMLIIGTKTAFLAAGVTVAALLIYCLVDWKRTGNKTELSYFVIAIFTTLAMFGLVTLFSGGQVIGAISESYGATEEFIAMNGAEAILSGRTGKLVNAFREWKSLLPVSALFGIGRGSQTWVIEMDLCEVFLYYGLLGTVLMLWLYLKHGILFLKDFFTRFSRTALCCALSLGLCVGYLASAGHTLFSVTSGFYFAFVLLYARVFCAERGLDTRIL
jgi:hypothetical protein